MSEIVLLSLFIMCVCVVHCEQDVCTVTSGSKMQVAIQSGRNKTGHWVAQVGLKYDGDSVTTTDASKSGPNVWLDVDLNAQSGCKGKQLVHIIATVTAPPQPARSPGPEYEYHPDRGYYKYHNVATAWHDAKTICEQEGNHLVIINSEEESMLVQQLASRFPKAPGATSSDYVIVGFHDLYVEGRFETVLGESINTTGFTRFTTGEPNMSAGNTEDCGLLHRTTGGLADVTCSWKLPFVCEQELW